MPAVPAQLRDRSIVSSSSSCSAFVLRSYPSIVTVVLFGAAWFLFRKLGTCTPMCSHSARNLYTDV